MWSFPLSFHCIWWLRKINKAMVEDYEIISEGWLQDATLFPAEPCNYTLNFDELLNDSGKTSNEVELDAYLPDLDWLDAKADISTLDVPLGLQIPSIDSNALNLEDAANLLDLLGSSLNTSDLFSVGKDAFDSTLFAAELSVISPEISGFSLDSPSYYAYPSSPSISAADSPASTSVLSDHTDAEFCLSPGEVLPYLDDGMYESISEAGSPASCSSSLASGMLDSPAVVSVTICSDDASSNSSHGLERTVSMDEVANAVRKRKYVSNGKEIPKVQVSLKNVFHPYAKATPKRSKGKYERKKVQNKEAAARYRIKKRVEEQGLSSEVSTMEDEQRELQKKHDALADEIKYLKKLMREVLQKKGVLK